MDTLARLLADLRVVGAPAGELGDDGGTWYRIEGQGDIGLLIKIRDADHTWEYITHTTYNV